MRRSKQEWKLPGSAERARKAPEPIVSDRTKLMIGAVLLLVAAASFVAAYLFTLG